MNVAKILLYDYKIPSIFIFLLINTFFCTGKDNRKTMPKIHPTPSFASFAIFLKFLITFALFLFIPMSKSNSL